MPSSPSSSPAMRPRRLGRSAKSWISGSAWTIARVFRLRSSGDWNSSPLLGEKFAAAELRDRSETLLVLRKRLRQRRRRLARQFRRRRLDDDEDPLEAAERLLEGEVAFAPAEIGREQRVDVRVDGEMPRDVDARPHRQQQSDDDHLPRIARAEIDDADNDGRQHGAGVIQSPDRSLWEQCGRAPCESRAAWPERSSRTLPGCCRHLGLGRLGARRIGARRGLCR